METLGEKKGENMEKNINEWSEKEKIDAKTGKKMDENKNRTK